VRVLGYSSTALLIPDVRIEGVIDEELLYEVVVCYR